MVSLEVPEGDAVLKGAMVEIASDVDNPFVGEKGAVAVRLFASGHVSHSLLINMVYEGLLVPKGCNGGNTKAT